MLNCLSKCYIIEQERAFKMKDAVQLIESLNIGEKPVVLACSYGPDSMCLFDLLKKAQINFVVAHVNHQLRVESDDEYNNLKIHCKNNDVIFEGMEITEYPKGNLEQNARVIRYNFFKEVLKKYQASYLFTAHHGDDLVETILMRLLRGASFKGYSGFGKVTKLDEYTLVRPLVFYTKDEVLAYVNEHNISYAEDLSNNEARYMRNRLRHQVLPILKKEVPKMHEKFLKFSEMLSEHEAYFISEIEGLYDKLYIDNTLKLTGFLALHPLFQKRLLNLILLRLYGNKINKINERHVSLILKLANSTQNNYVVLPDNIKVAKSYNKLSFNAQETEQASYDCIIEDEVLLPTGKIVVMTEDDEEKSNDIIRLNSEELILPLRVRTRRNGDFMAVKNLNGTKKISILLIDSKIEKIARITWPVVTDSAGNVLWLPGLKKSKNDKQKPETYDIILKYIQKGDKNEK